jgi:hypothetical protein
VTRHQRADGVAVELDWDQSQFTHGYRHLSQSAR